MAINGGEDKYHCPTLEAVGFGGAPPIGRHDLIGPLQQASVPHYPEQYDVYHARGYHVFVGTTEYKQGTPPLQQT